MILYSNADYPIYDHYWHDCDNEELHVYRRKTGWLNAYATILEY